MKIVFVHQGGPQFASYRYRAAIPAEELAKLGHETAINDGIADVVAFSKPMLTDVQIAEKARGDGAKIIFDLGDDHLAHPILGPIYQKMMELAHLIVTPTLEMAERVYRVSGRSAEIIPDPYEEELQAPHACEGERLLWFGHQLNLKDLTPWRPLLNGLRIVTGPTPSKHILWSRETQTIELAYATIVVLPVRPGVEFKSNNRILNSVRGGCFVITAPHPSHDEFRRFLWVGHIKTGLDWARAFRGELDGLVAQAQDYVEEHYAPTVIARRWAQVVENIA